MQRSRFVEGPRNRLGSRKIQRLQGNASPRRGKILAIAYDGERTEDDYFKGWKRRLGTQGIELRPFYIQSGGNAYKAVAETIRLTDPDREEIWCVCDADDTTTRDLNRAIDLAKQNNINLCLSVRCFEVWIALHWDRISVAPLTCERDAIALVRKRHKKYSKDAKYVPFTVLHPLSKAACDNAEWLIKQNVVNPATLVHRLVRKLIELDEA
ncbi:RloB family protein [Microvirga sp. G4-2]|uniref:RloB family protein n=1 Tax=Microvirga sp. G4-2 TaxID=3434467 RepID=UPI004043F69A